MLACAANRRGALGRLRRVRGARARGRIEREAQGDRVGVVRVEPSGLVPYKPLLDAAIAMVESKPGVASSSSDRYSRPSSSPAETSTGRRPSRSRPGGLRSGRRDRSALHPLHLRNDRAAQVVRDNGGHAVALAWTMKHIYDVQSRRGLLGCIRRRLGRRALVHRVRAPPARLHDGALRREAGRHADAGAF